MQNALTSESVCVCVDVLRRINTLMHVLALTAAIICEYIIMAHGFRPSFLGPALRQFAQGLVIWGLVIRFFPAFVFFFWD